MRPVTPVMIELDRPRPLLLTFRGMKAFEDATGGSLLVPGAWSETTSRELRALLWACLLHDEPTMTLEQAGAMVMPGDIQTVTDAVLLACERSVSEPDAERDEDEGEPGEESRITWLRLWSVGRVDLGLSEDEFWGLTPLEFDTLLKRNNLKLEREDFRAGIIASTIANANRDPKKKPDPWTAADFMPTRNGKPRQKRQTWQEQLEIVKALNAAFGGTQEEAVSEEPTA